MHYKIQDEMKPDAAYYAKNPGKSVPPGAKTLGGSTKAKKKKQSGGRSSFLETEVAEAPWSVAERAVALRFDNPRATVLVLVLG